MSQPAHDAMVSYSRNDLARVSQLIRALQDRGLRVAWDGAIQPGQVWAEMLSNVVANSRCTLICITPAAVQSMWVEAEMKRSHGRIIPVLLERTALPLIWEAYIGRIQWADLSASRFSSDDPAFAQLCAVVAGRVAGEQAAGEETVAERARRLIEHLSPADCSLLLAVALLGGASKEDVTMLAADFERRQQAYAGATSSGPPPLEAISSRLKRIGAEIFDRVDDRFGIKVECVRFVEHSLGHAVLALAWSDYEALRAPILDWIAGWSAQSPLWIRMRLALSLGVLAQDERRFDPIWRLVLKPMLFDNARRRERFALERFELADAALSIAALDPSRRSTVEAILDQMLAADETPEESPSKPPSGRAAPLNPAATTAPPPAATVPVAAEGPAAAPPVAAPAPASPAEAAGAGEDLAAGGGEHARAYLVARLALGCTGARYADLAVTAMRRLAERGDYGLLARIIGQNFRDRMRAAKDAFDGSLWDPIGILLGLVRWAEKAPTEDCYVPLMIFAYGLSALPLASRRDDHLSLTSIMRSKRGVDALRLGFSRGLANPATRDAFEQRLRSWRDEQEAEPVEPDPVFAVACLLVHAGPTERDRNRVRFLFRHRYAEPALSALALQEPELSRRLEA